MKEITDESNSGTWISVENPDDLHELIHDDFDVELFNEHLHPYKVLLDLPPPILEFVNEDVDEEDELAQFADVV